MTTEKAYALVDEFAARTAPGKFTKLSRAKVAEGVRERIKNPFLIAQSVTGTCAPAAVVHGLAKDRPLDYAAAVTGLFDVGAWTIGKWALKPDVELFGQPCPVSADFPFSEADWVILASIRDSENWFFDFHSERDHFGDGNSVSEPKDWMKKAGFTDVQTDDGGLVYSTLNDKDRMIRKCLELYNSGYHVILSINSSIIDAQLKPYPKLSGSNHVVAMAGTFEIPADRSNKISIPVFTWGKKLDIPRTGTLTYTQFLEHFTDYVAGKA